MPLAAVGRGLILSCGVVLAAVPAMASDFGSSLTIQLENDWFAKAAGVESDQDYTTGIRIAYLSGPVGVPEWVVRLGDVPALFGPEDDNSIWRWGLSINQNIYTPEDTEATDLVEDDRPYAGWLYLGLTLQAIRRAGDEAVRLDTFDLALGVVGPAALGRQLQNNFHEVIEDDQSQGWDNQLKNEPAVNFTYERRWRTGGTQLSEALGLEMDALPFAGLALGNVYTYGAVGSIFRVGNNLKKDFGPPRNRPGMPGSEAFFNDGTSWYLFAGFEGQAVARNIFLDGNSFQDSHSVDKYPLVGEAQAGVAFFVNSVRVTYTHVLRTPEFEEQDRIQQYGSLSLSLSF